jgi:hypothetical protein
LVISQSVASHLKIRLVVIAIERFAKSAGFDTIGLSQARMSRQTRRKPVMRRPFDYKPLTILDLELHLLNHALHQADSYTDDLLSTIGKSIRSVKAPVEDPEVPEAIAAFADIAERKAEFIEGLLVPLMLSVKSELRQWYKQP